MLYKIIAEASVGTEKEDYLVKAEEALKEAFDLRTTLTGTPLHSVLPYLFFSYPLFFYFYYLLSLFLLSSPLLHYLIIPTIFILLLLLLFLLLHHCFPLISFFFILFYHLPLLYTICLHFNFFALFFQYSTVCFTLLHFPSVCYF